MEPRELTRLRGERDLYLRLLTLGRQDSPEPFLEEALAVIVDIGEARQGYLELHDDAAPEAPRWWRAHGIPSDEIEKVRAAISHGIIAESIATGQTILTPSALLDPRFKERESVRLGQIEAVLCAPIGEDPPIGVLYLQGRADAGVFSEGDRSLAETFCRLLAPLAARVLAEERRKTLDNDATLEFRRTLALDGIIGHSEALAANLRQVALVSPLEINVLLTGDSGTGKSLLARVIHANGPRAKHPFVELNCAAIPEALVESELFGAMPGAHSTAVQRVEGKVSAAEGGTLFLDEIGELPLTSQAKLLQLVQSKEFYPLGATRPVRANVRVIAATNTDLGRAVQENTFRQDLYYRLNVLPIRVASLAERRGDIPALAEHYVAQACEHNHLPRLELSRNARRALEAAEWPGNVRQLAHTVEAAAIRAAHEGSQQIEREHLFPEGLASGRHGSGNALTFQLATRRFQGELLRRTLEDTGWNVSETANRLELARSHVYNLIRAFGLERR